jgi:hypothetical protein
MCSYCYVCSVLDILFRCDFCVLFVCRSKCVLYYCHRVATRLQLINTYHTISYVLFVCKCVLYYCHRVATQLQLTNTCHTISYVLFVCKCVVCYCHRVATQLQLTNTCHTISYVLFVCKCVLYYCHRVATQLQLTNKSYHIIIPKHVGVTLFCILYVHLLGPAIENSLIEMQRLSSSKMFTNKIVLMEENSSSLL